MSQGSSSVLSLTPQGALEHTHHRAGAIFRQGSWPLAPPCQWFAGDFCGVGNKAVPISLREVLWRWVYHPGKEHLSGTPTALTSPRLYEDTMIPQGFRAKWWHLAWSLTTTPSSHTCMEISLVAQQRWSKCGRDETHACFFLTSSSSRQIPLGLMGT